ncbi:MAG: cellulose biosynthesis cyclic di-GMP-binding regulatory protein BcsB [Symploca sp. SIO2E9]|nr:cellulose biosynthesis cyclic di-GMP-binding regulatory protein BcsB [Symploca sp. SIO2E9]
MKCFFLHKFTSLLPLARGSHRLSRFKRHSLVLLFVLAWAVPIGLRATLVQAQSNSPEATETSPPIEKLRENNTQQRKDRAGSAFILPSPPPKAPEVEALPAGDPYVLEFNRSPVVGNSFSLKGIYDEARLGFTRPRDWQLKSVKALIRYRHSPALYATRSNLTVLINDASIGSIPLNRKEGEIGNQVFAVPLDKIQNYNQITIAALQNNSPTCTQDPYDPSLWTEILPDSKITFDYEPQPLSLDFKSYPYPIFDELSLYPNQITYLLPSKVDNTWLTAANRFQASLGRLADYRRLETRLVKAVDEVESLERLVIIGTPLKQPELKSLSLPLPLKDNQILDSKQKVLPPDVGVLILTTTPENTAPVLVATGNGPEGVEKAVQFLVNFKDRQMSTGQIILVDKLEDIPSPPENSWPGYLPRAETFQLSDLINSSGQPFEDITVRGSDSPPIEIDFQALPDDRFESGNSMTLSYSYGPQINAKTSLVEVKLDGVTLVGKRFTSINGGTREKLRVNLPADRIKPTSKIQVDFRLDARERRSCSRVTDQQLWGTLHTDTSFELNRTRAVKLPNLELLRYGFPFAAPQDLSNTAIIVPSEPSVSDLMTALELSGRLGRLSSASSVQLAVYTANSFPKQLRDQRHLVGIGTSSNFPFPKAMKSGGFELRDASTRRRNQSDIQTSPDNDGLIKEIISPWSNKHVLLVLSGQTEKGLERVQDLFHQDPLFFQVQEDTVLISANSPNPEIYDPNAYNLKFLQRENKREVDKTPPPKQFFRLVGSWLFLAPAIVALTLLIYGVIQVYFKRISEHKV